MVYQLRNIVAKR